MLGYVVKSYEPAERKERFFKFIDTHLTLTERAYTMLELENVAEKFDAIICGSDQMLIHFLCG